MRLTKLLATLFITSALIGCSSDGKKVEADIPEDQLYEQALSAIDAGNNNLAVEKLQLLEARYPFGRYSEQAQLELIYAHFRLSQNTSAAAAADRFIRLHPNHDNVDYAYYMKGLSAFEAERSFFAKYLPIDVAQRDPGAARDSFDSFTTLINRFPDSEYAADAQRRMQYLKNRLATYEIHVAIYYMKRQAWLAAANRGRYVVENLQETPATSDALAIMVEAYTELGLTDLANSSKAVLAKNFPDYEVRSFKEPRNDLIYTASFGLLGEGTELAEPIQPTSPVARPVRADEAVIAPTVKGSSDAAQPAERSWFDRITFGVFE
ncbi:outer membrane protein assembly factor BamD [Marinobacterium sp. LSUCC0821]|jgi:outer membrane protein assembly factor BamD|uniref:outer membrane protein assembly factor BamD n=1 Tax=Marinobacterium sp. LSUCC0821 TaxID=2668067 RepID=UPI0014529722|nr:outer membrane protein assembly factor BamD [Marinobacterium sp. LSUCC0821]QJD72262.1 outer membrane protein assembly factor BamD [Marinobacterium sp. LSUCC0821]